jgi:hypothetical protein
MIPVPIPLLETLSKIFNGNAVKGCQRFSLNLCNVSKLPLLLAKNRMVVVSYPSYLFDLTPCDFFLFSGMNRDLKGRYVLMLQRFNENRWQPLTAFRFKILANVSSSWNGAVIAASGHCGSAWKGSKV